MSIDRLISLVRIGMEGNHITVSKELGKYILECLQGLLNDSDVSQNIKEELQGIQKIIKESAQKQLVVYKIYSHYFYHMKCYKYQENGMNDIFTEDFFSHQNVPLIVQTVMQDIEFRYTTFNFSLLLEQYCAYAVRYLKKFFEYLDKSEVIFDHEKYEQEYSNYKSLLVNILNEMKFPETPEILNGGHWDEGCESALRQFWKNNNYLVILGQVYPNADYHVFMTGITVPHSADKMKVAFYSLKINVITYLKSFLSELAEL